MTSPMLFGCVNLRGPIETYARRFDLVEVDVFSGRKPPSPATLRRWRKDAGPTLHFALVAPEAVALTRPGPKLDAALEQWLEAQRLLQAQTLVLRTPIDVSPAPLWRERLAAVTERVRAGLGDAARIVRIAWEPRGLWEPKEAANQCAKLDLDLAGDPLIDPQEPFFHERLRYVRVGTVGGRTEYPATRLRYLADLLSEVAKESDTKRAVVFSTPHAPREIKRLRTLIASLMQDAPGGQSRVLRPSKSFALSEEEE